MKQSRPMLDLMAGKPVELIRSDRKTISLEITKDARIVIRAPLTCPIGEIERFFRQKERWLTEHLERQEQKLALYPPPTNEQIAVWREQAKRVIPARVAHFAAIMGGTPSFIGINAAKTRFGSCSGSGRLHFSCLLMRYPPEAIDYVVVHELAHIRHHNHQADFYKEIAAVLPDHRRREALLKGK